MEMLHGLLFGAEARTDERGGYHVQFNIFDADVLRRAKAHPEKYRDLIVRVAGFSVYFVELAALVQDEIIARTEHDL